MTRPTATAAEPLSTLLLLAVSFGMVSGLVEVLALLGKRAMTGHMLFRSRAFVWTAPLAVTAVCLLAAAVIFLARRMLPRLDARWWTIFTCGSIAAWNPLMLLPGVHHAASLLLALGIGARAAHMATEHQEAVRTFARRLVLVLPVMILALTVLTQGAPWVEQKLAARRLPAAADNAPNVLLIVLDTVRARNLSLYGYERDTSPTLVRWAREGVVFERAISTAPWTLTSHASMFTGRFPHEVSADWDVPLDAAYPTLAELLTSRGYATAGIVANLGYTSYETGLARGFLHYEDYTLSMGQIAADSTLVKTIADNFRIRRLIRNDEHLNRKSATDVTKSALRWLSRPREGPFFLFLNYFDAHEPYLAPPPFDAEFGRRGSRRRSPLHHFLWDPAVGSMSDAEVREEMGAYDGAIAYLDAQLSRLFDELDRRGLAENLLVVVTADHGEELGEHGLFDHGNSLYLPALHVPLIISFPPRVPAGRRVVAPVSLNDLAATIVDLLDISSGASIPGGSLARFWSETPPIEPVPALSEVSRGINTPEEFPVSRGDMKSLVDAGHHYIRDGDGSEELYATEDDPDEQIDLATGSEAASVLARLRITLEALLRR